LSTPLLQLLHFYGLRFMPENRSRIASVAGGQPLRGA